MKNSDEGTLHLSAPMVIRADRPPQWRAEFFDFPPTPEELSALEVDGWRVVAMFSGPSRDNTNPLGVHVYLRSGR